MQFEKQTQKLAILAVEISFPNRAKYPRTSEDALRCDAQMSPSTKIFFHSNLANKE
jgi:hypothetical protein